MVKIIRILTKEEFRKLKIGYNEKTKKIFIDSKIFLNKNHIRSLEIKISEIPPPFKNVKDLDEKVQKMLYEKYIFELKSDYHRKAFLGQIKEEKYSESLEENWRILQNRINDILLGNLLEDKKIKKIKKELNLFKKELTKWG